MNKNTPLFLVVDSIKSDMADAFYLLYGQFECYHLSEYSPLSDEIRKASREMYDLIIITPPITMLSPNILNETEALIKLFQDAGKDIYVITNDEIDPNGPLASIPKENIFKTFFPVSFDQDDFRNQRFQETIFAVLSEIRKRATPPTPVCANCKNFYIKGDKYCRFCGAPMGTPDYIREAERHSTVYGPMARRDHKCEKCGYAWTKTSMSDREFFCPQCGSKVSITIIRS